MTIGISMGHEICLIIGQVSLIFFIGRKTSRRIYVVARSFMARTLEDNGKERQSEGAKVVE